MSKGRTEDASAYLAWQNHEPTKGNFMKITETLVKKYGKWVREWANRQCQESIFYLHHSTDNVLRPHANDSDDVWRQRKRKWELSKILPFMELGEDRDKLLAEYYSLHY